MTLQSNARSAALGAVVFSALFTHASAVLAFGTLGTNLNTTCTTRGGTPPQPYTAGNCTLCHDDGAGGPGAGKTAYAASNWDYFCPVAKANTAPTANAGGPYTAQAGQALGFDGSASKDAENDPLTYRWDFGDGSTDTTSGAKPTHTYATPGSYKVALIVNDGVADSVSATTTAEISGQTAPPVAELQLSLINDWAGKVGVPMNIPLSATDPQGKSLFFSASGLPSGLALVDNGDGTGNINGTPQTAGGFTPTVTVSDNGSPARMDSQTFKLAISDTTEPPAGDVQFQTRANAKWDRMSKKLRVRGRVVPLANITAAEMTSESCMPLAGKSLTVMNEAGKTLLTGDVGCQGQIRLEGLVNIQDTSCTVNVAVDGVAPVTASVHRAPGCKDSYAIHAGKKHGHTRNSQEESKELED